MYAIRSYYVADAAASSANDAANEAASAVDESAAVDASASAHPSIISVITSYSIHYTKLYELRYIPFRSLPTVLKVLDSVGITTFQTGIDNFRNIVTSYNFV